MFVFVIRVAGNTLDDAIVGSIEYAVEHLGVQFIAVLGHSRCGAVTAAVEGGKSSDHTSSLIAAIAPAVAEAAKQPGDLLTNAIKANVEMVVAQLRMSKPVLAEKVKEENLEIVAALYDLDSGKVAFGGSK